MKIILIVIFSVFLTYGFFREFTVVRILAILVAAVSCFALYRLPQRYIEAMKYPFIILSFAVTGLFFFYPKIALAVPFQLAVAFLSFYAFILYLTGMEEKAQDLFKEAAALSMLFFSCAFNLYITGKLIFLISFSLALILYLFILGRHRVIPLIGTYLVITGVMLYRQGVNLFGYGLTEFSSANKYSLLGSSLILLVMSLTVIMKKNTFIGMLPFFGFLYIAMDVLLVVGVKFSNGLLYQPFLFLAIVVPFTGIMLKTEGRH